MTEQKFYQKLAEKLDSKRVQKDYSFNKLAQKTNIPASTLKDYLSAKTPIPAFKLKCIADVLQIPIYELFETETAPPNSNITELKYNIDQAEYALNLQARALKELKNLLKN